MRRLTQAATGGGNSPAFSSVLLASSFLCSRQSPPSLECHASRIQTVGSPKCCTGEKLNMIHELQQANSKVLALHCSFPEARAIIEGNNPGWLFVDDLNTPSAGLVWAKGMEGFYLIGDANNTKFLDELDIFTEQVLKPRLHDLGMTWLEIGGDESWNLSIENAYRKRRLKSSQQWVYTLKATKQEPGKQFKAINDRRVERIDRDLLARLFEDNEKFLLSKLTRFWYSVDAFINTGLGYVFLDGEEIVSLCFSGFVAGNIHVIDIETKVIHRRKGYAESVSQAFVADCINREIQPYWDCMAENIASARLAERLGFRKNRIYTLYSVSLE